MSALGTKAPVARRPSSAAWTLGLAVIPLKESAARHLAIIKLQGSIGEDLIVLMTLAGEQHHVPRRGVVHSQPNGFFPVSFNHVFAAGFLQADNNVADDFQGILAARVVA